MQNVGINLEIHTIIHAYTCVHILLRIFLTSEKTPSSTENYFTSSDPRHNTSKHWHTQQIFLLNACHLLPATHVRRTQTMPNVLYLWSICKARLMFWTWNDTSLATKEAATDAHIKYLLQNDTAQKLTWWSLWEWSPNCLSNIVRSFVHAIGMIWWKGNKWNLSNSETSTYP